LEEFMKRVATVRPVISLFNHSLFADLFIFQRNQRFTLHEI
jgi:hypothetical protein